jgi:hypothetical protein
MANIFDTIGAGLEKVLGNPYVQGAGMMAATGFNPLIGLLGGSIIKNKREAGELALEQQRMANEGSRRQLDAQSRLSNLATEMRPMDRVPGAPLAILGMEGEHIGYAPGLPGVIPSETPEVPAAGWSGGKYCAGRDGNESAGRSSDRADADRRDARAERSGAGRFHDDRSADRVGRVDCRDENSRNAEQDAGT